jgi:hypothetical protein
VTQFSENEIFCRKFSFFLKLKKKFSPKKNTKPFFLGKAVAIFMLYWLLVFLGVPWNVVVCRLFLYFWQKPIIRRHTQCFLIMKYSVANSLFFLKKKIRLKGTENSFSGGGFRHIYAWPAMKNSFNFVSRQY